MDERNKNSADSLDIHVDIHDNIRDNNKPRTWIPRDFPVNVSDDLRWCVLQWLLAPDFRALSCVNVKWRQLTQSDKAWKHLSLTFMPVLSRTDALELVLVCASAGDTVEFIHKYLARRQQRFGAMTFSEVLDDLRLALAVLCGIRYRDRIGAPTFPDEMTALFKKKEEDKSENKNEKKHSRLTLLHRKLERERGSGATSAPDCYDATCMGNRVTVLTSRVHPLKASYVARFAERKQIVTTEPTFLRYRRDLYLQAAKWWSLGALRLLLPIWLVCAVVLFEQNHIEHDDRIWTAFVFPYYMLLLVCVLQQPLPKFAAPLCISYLAWLFWLVLAPLIAYAGIGKVPWISVIAYLQAAWLLRLVYAHFDRQKEKYVGLFYKPVATVTLFQYALFWRRVFSAFRDSWVYWLTPTYLCGFLAALLYLCILGTSTRAGNERRLSFRVWGLAVGFATLTSICATIHVDAYVRDTDSSSSGGSSNVMPAWAVALTTIPLHLLNAYHAYFVDWRKRNQEKMEILRWTGVPHILSNLEPHPLYEAYIGDAFDVVMDLSHLSLCRRFASANLSCPICSSPPSPITALSVSLSHDTHDTHESAAPNYENNNSNNHDAKEPDGLLLTLLKRFNLPAAPAPTVADQIVEAT